MIQFKVWRLLRECLECLENQDCLLTEAALEEIPQLLKNNDEEEFFRTIEPVVKTAISQYLAQHGNTSKPDYFDDVVQNTLTNIFRNLKGDRGIPMRKDHHAEMIAFIRTIATNTLIDHLRKQKRRQPTAQVPENIPDVGTDYSTKELVRMALDKLPETFKNILQWSYFDDYTNVEIARMLGIPVGTVKSRLNAAKKKMAEIISKLR